MKTSILEDAFTSLMTSCDLNSASPQQRHEMRCAFYAGAFKCFESAVEESADATDAQAEQRLIDLRAELDEFIVETKIRAATTQKGGSA